MAARKKTSKKKAKRKRASKRELIDTGTNKLFVRRNARGTSFPWHFLHEGGRCGPLHRTG